MYEEYNIYGPYDRKDGRKHMCLIHKTNRTRKTISYPKYRMECILGRYLNENEEVHHKDENLSNNEDDNFQLVDGTIHKSYHGKLKFKYVAEYWKCIVCGKEWLATPKQISTKISKQKHGKSLIGPFCSRSCQGKICN